MTLVPHKNSQLELSDIIQARKVNYLQLANSQLEYEINTNCFQYQGRSHIAKTAQCHMVFQTIERCNAKSQEQANLVQSVFAMYDQLPYHIKQLCKSPCCTATISKTPHGNHRCQSKVRKSTKCAHFKPFNFLVQQHNNTQPTESNTTKYVLIGFV